MREAPTKDEPERNKLASVATGPNRVVKTSSKNVVIINASGFDDTVSRDRIVLAPTPKGGLPMLNNHRTFEERLHEKRPRVVTPKVPATNLPLGTRERRTPICKST